MSSYCVNAVCREILLLMTVLLLFDSSCLEEATFSAERVEIFYTAHQVTIQMMQSFQILQPDSSMH